MEMKSPPPCPNTVTVRRNPHRRARPTPSTNPPQNIIPSSTTNKPDILPFPIEDIMSMEIPQNPQPDPPLSSPTPASVSENLRVYLRIRPLVSPKTSKDVIGQERNKNAWPQNPVAKKNSLKAKNTKKRSSNICISVNDPQSVTLSPPPALQESKRIKSVVYEGFSRVFAVDSSQNEVYENMVKPLVEDFINGKNGMLAALGPSGSGKTHTVFGTAKEPGMVPLALQHIFKQTKESDSKLSRSFYVSIFEIYSEGGKAERIFDLSPGGAMPQSTVKGLQQVAINDPAHAESLIASAMLKRSTATTNANSQSSRSQCIINIHGLLNEYDKELDVQSNNCMLTIVDLAGAERERRTRNQGSRLLESNFINNTSMVFGLCLRSLLEHQKNPKKPLQKHFQNSLVLTVKPGEEDYLDTVYLLRQASPYMKIKFNNVDEQLNSVHQKRHIQSLCRVEAPKRKKYCALDSNETEGKSTGDKHQLLEEVTDGPQKSKFDSTNIALVKDDCVDLTIRDRNHQIMQNFAKALWNILKEYKEKLMVADKEIESLNENLGSEKSRYIKLEKEFEDFKSCCTCSKENSMEALKVDTDFHAKVYIAGNECSNFDEAKVKLHSPNLKVSECAGATHDQDVTSRMDESVHPPNLKEPKCSSTPTWDLVFSTQAGVELHSPNLEATECTSTPTHDQDVISLVCESVHSPNLTEYKCSSTPTMDSDISTQVEVRSHSPNLKASVCISTPEHDQCVTTQVDEGVHSPNVKESKCRSTPTWDQDIPSQTEVKSHSPSLKASECTITATHDQDVTSQMGESVHSPSLRESKYTKSPTWDQDISVQVDVNVHSPHSEASKYSSTQDQAQDFLTKKQLDLPPSEEDVASSKQCNLDLPDCEIRSDTKQLDLPPSEEDVVSSKQCNLDVPDCGIRSDNSCKSLNLKKPKRRLLPASSILLRDITAFGIEDEPQKPKGNRGGKILPANEKTQGSISLRRLLQSNLRL
ncbi:hypothetical protein MANES_18G012000v8 [Manihot esculenta]|uniref:Uncharacterized protein n=1 Tax=Manihot esculenta TaxID=3983 RepID=A0ACB7FXF6_MANES|nr:hypothetical protein MANES_18G012000v8 [Manihot esculenta]